MTVVTLANTYTDPQGVIRWNSNDNVPPQDALEHMGITNPRTLAICREARERDTARHLAAYREAMKNHVPSDEEMFEMRAAFGPGEEVVNVITGQTYRT